MKDGVELDNNRVYNHRFRTELNRRDILNLIFDTFPILHDAYELKEFYRRINKEASYEDAVEIFPRIKRLFAECGINEYVEFCGILNNWENEILNSFKRPYDDKRLSNAYTEHINGKLKTYFTIARRLKNFDRFRKRALYALNPNISYAITGKLHSECTKGRKRGSYNKIKE